ncbi:hypothetical protein SLEP1_g7492 [Rubroshorea leprosula]|uniref:Lysosomal Pro-X carboxypeptidase n=1 Tax=Rubroshorea leprosula TaxID=152421 RepID=A0AAV5I7L9_9ROSI|nr:hypothetical protein SLEP1_g7492 [Rubroshorea leprosula]
MGFLRNSCQLPLFFLIVFLLSSSATGFKRFRRSRFNHEPEITTSAPSNDTQTPYFYNQTLDHFSYKPESYITFRQRYVIDYKYWNGANAPIFVDFGGEWNIGNAPSNGFLTAIGPRFKALIVFLEHRFYGQSIPLGSMEKAMKNTSVQGCFTTAQALADYAAIILHLKETIPAAESSPVIVFGCSYAGMLAAWFRLKYPHIAYGALASSAPVLYFDGFAQQVGYYTIVSKDFNATSRSCHETIRKSWEEIDLIASRPDGLSILGQKFRTCSELKKSFDLKDYLDSIYAEAAQYNEPPRYPLTTLCRAIDGAAEGTDVLGRILAGVVAFVGNQSCYDMDEYNEQTDTSLAWGWQTCMEIVMPVGHEVNDTMFQFAPFDLSSYVNDCEKLYGVQPQPHWISTYFGTHDFKFTLHRFASNIIFSNGLSDPYSSGGVLENISDSVVAINTVNGSHCLDLRPAEESDDPEWLRIQRENEVDTIQGWISQYYSDLKFRG